MKKIGMIFCLLFVLLTNVNANTSKDILIKYEYTDNTSKYTKEIVNNEVEYNLNNNKIKFKLYDNTNKNVNILFFEVSKESLDWLKTKVNINENSNVYYLKIIDDKNNELISSITIEEYSEENKVIKIYGKEGNELEKPSNNCYIVIEKVNDKQTENNNEYVNVYRDITDVIKGEEKNISPLIIFIMLLIVICIILCILIKTRKDKNDE